MVFSTGIWSINQNNSIKANLFSNNKFYTFSTEMTANDCFEMGRQSYLNKDYYHTALWMREAMDRLTSDTNHTTSTSKADILEYLAFSVYKQGK